MTLSGLDQPCLACSKRSGSHTLDEWEACLGAPSHDLPYDDVPEDVQQILHQRFAGLEGYALSDTIDVRAAMVGGGTGPVGFTSPVLLLDFQVGSPAGPRQASKVAFLGTSTTMRKFGVLVRDAANAAANKIDKRK